MYVGRETPEAAHQRSIAVANKIWNLCATSDSEDKDSAFLFVVHGLFFDRMIKALMSIPAPADASQHCTWFLSANCAISIVDFTVTKPEGGGEAQNKVFVATMDMVEHLSPELRSKHKMGGLEMRPLCFPSMEEAVAAPAAPKNGAA